MANLIDIIDDAIRDLPEDASPIIADDLVAVSRASDTSPVKVKLTNLVGTVLAALRSAFTPASAANPASLDFHEDTDTGTNKIRVIAPSAIASDKTQTLQDASGTIALTADITTAINNVINAAPGALDTLDELAAALGDDANFAATVTTALALKAPLASPALTGNPTAPTQAPGDNSTKIATTAYVEAAVTAGGASLSFKTIQVAGQSDVVADSSTDTLILAAGSGVTITTNAGSDTITIAASGGGGGGIDMGKTYALASGLALP